MIGPSDETSLRGAVPLLPVGAVLEWLWRSGRRGRACAGQLDDLPGLGLFEELFGPAAAADE